MDEKEPLLLVPTYQFQHLLDVVNAKLETRLTIPPGRNEVRFKMTFGLGGSPRPRFLGRSTDPNSYDELRKAVPEPDPADDLSKATEYGQEQFRGLVQKSRANRKRDKKDKNRLKRIRAHRDWGRSIKRVQRYLGLRGRTRRDTTDKPAVVDIMKSMVENPEDSVLFVAIDLEAWEQDQHVITEIGIAMLDAAETRGIAPGKGGENWFELIEARHIRVKENSWANNSRFVKGCPEYFNFG
jgi:hypothetical protein